MPLWPLQPAVRPTGCVGGGRPPGSCPRRSFPGRGAGAPWARTSRRFCHLGRPRRAAVRSRPSNGGPRDSTQ
eukprot:158426-Pyramimonas_sp.AAC.1